MNKVMKFIIGGQNFQIESLDPNMDRAFIDLHAAYFSNQAMAWDDFKSKSTDFFSKHYSDRLLTRGFFRNFTIIWKRYLNKGLWDQAENIWELALEPAIEWENNNEKKRVHKGGPYYFWGMTAIQRGDLDRGFSLMHQALAEDVITSGEQFPDTPSLAFAALDYENVEQAFRQWVLLEAQYLDKQITIYNKERDRAFSLDQFRSKYLQAPPSVDAIYLLAYTIARLLRLEKLPKYLLSSPFAGQLLQNHLFDLVQIVDETIAKKNPGKWKMIDHINHLSRKARILISKVKLVEVNRKFQSNFEDTMDELANHTFEFKDRTTPTNLQVDLLVVYGLRNRGAHKVSSAPIVWQEFPKIRNSVFNSLFLSAEVLY